VAARYYVLELHGQVRPARCSSRPHQPQPSTQSSSHPARPALPAPPSQVIAQLMITFEWSDWRAADVWWIQSVYVSPEHRQAARWRAPAAFNSRPVWEAPCGRHRRCMRPRPAYPQEAGPLQAPVPAGAGGVQTSRIRGAAAVRRQRQQERACGCECAACRCMCCEQRQCQLAMWRRVTCMLAISAGAGCGAGAHGSVAAGAAPQHPTHLGWCPCCCCPAV
jgi:hypothetical protein